jgi:hypothetical protein
MVSAQEVAPVGPDVFVWQAYDPSVKADLWSTALLTPAGPIIIDPIPVEPGLALEAPPVAIVVTNENHERSAAEFCGRFGAPVFAHPVLQGRISAPIVESIPLGDGKWLGCTAISIDGAPSGEIAIHYPANGGALVIGDALINFEPSGFALLPAKYCSDSRLMRVSLNILLDYDFERIVFAHGSPILANGRQRLEKLLSGTK